MNWKLFRGKVTWCKQYNYSIYQREVDICLVLYKYGRMGTRVWTEPGWGDIPSFVLPHPSHPLSNSVWGMTFAVIPQLANTVVYSSWMFPERGVRESLWQALWKRRLLHHVGRFRSLRSTNTNLWLLNQNLCLLRGLSFFFLSWPSQITFKEI